jgi:hypothetical protein
MYCASFVTYEVMVDGIYSECVPAKNWLVCDDIGTRAASMY